MNREDNPVDHNDQQEDIFNDNDDHLFLDAFAAPDPQEDLFPDNANPFLQAAVDPPLLDADHLADIVNQPHPIAVVAPAAVLPPIAQAPAAMDAAQLAQLLALVRPASKRVTPFTSGDGLEFVSWRRNFRLAVQINGWANDDDRARREAAAAIEDPAARIVADIPTIAGTAEEYLDLCEARFMPAAATDVARVALETAIQEADETIIQWHARLRALFQRAYPNVLPAAVEQDHRLITQFILKCKSGHVRADAWKIRPQTFAAAYTAASNAAASQMVLEANDNPGAPPKMGKLRPGMMAISKPRAAPRKDQQRCWFCDEAGHLRLHCTMWLKAKRMLDDDPRAPRRMREASPKREDRKFRGTRGAGTGKEKRRGQDTRRQDDNPRRRDPRGRRGVYGMEEEDSDCSEQEEESGN